MKSSVFALAAMALACSACQRERKWERHPLPQASNMPLQAAATPPAARENARGGELIEGTVREVLQVPQYTYLKLAVSDKQERWAAISTKVVPVGARITVLAETNLAHFESPTLHRAFDDIAFGKIYAPPADVAAACAMNHSAKTPDDRPDGRSHIASGADPIDVTVERLPRAEGALGRTVEEILNTRRALSGRRVRVRGTIVRVAYDILGRTFLHLRDGTGDSKSATNDLAATTTQRPNKGDTLLLEGRLVTDKDLGSGYRYAALLEEAKVVVQ